MFDSVPVVDGRIRKYELYRYTTAQPFPATANPSEVTIDTRASAMDSLLMLNRSFIDVKFSLRVANNGPLPAAEHGQIVQNAWDMFSRAILYINDSEVENVDMPGIVSHIKRLVESSRGHIEGQGPSSGYYPDADAKAPVALDDGTAAGANPAVPPALTDTMRYRAGARYFAPGVHHVRLYLRDIFGFCDVNKALMGARVSIRLTPESVQSRIIQKSADSTASQVRFEGCDFYLPAARPDNATLNAIYKEVNSGKVIPFEFETYTYNQVVIANGSTSVNTMIPNSHRRPTAVHVLMQLDSQRGTLAGDKLAGKLFGLRTSRVRVDSKQYPEVGYEGETMGYIHEYETFLQTGGKHRDDVWGTFVDFDKWKNVYPVISYDVSTSRDELNAVRSNPAIVQWEANYANPGAASTAHVIVVGKQVRELAVVNDLLVTSAPMFSD